jgi:two-component SAPR family response regulator
MLWDYGQSGAQQNVLEVRALGAGQVILNGRVIRDWDGALPRSLFFFLVDRGMATRTEIFETFWPQLTTREATNVFHVTKRKVNEILGLDFTVYASGYYRISSDLQLAYDALIFTQLCQLGEIEEAAEAEPALRKALSMYHGHFLSGLEMPWAVERRAELRASYGDSLLILAGIKEAKGELEAALSLYVRAFAASPGDADIVRHVMHLYDHLGMQSDALAAFERYQRSERGNGDAAGLSTLAAAIRTRVGERVNN